MKTLHEHGEGKEGKPESYFIDNFTAFKCPMHVNICNGDCKGCSACDSCKNKFICKSECVKQKFILVVCGIIVFCVVLVLLLTW